MNDPVVFIRRYREDRDREIAGFLASQFAYGKIETFRTFLEKLFALMGESPFSFIKAGDFSGVRGLYYRFQKDKDIVLLLQILQRIIDEFGNIGAMLRYFYRGDIREALWAAREHLFRNGNELTFFFPKPSSTNPMKRWSLYLRWMVRKDAIDIGIWGFIDKRALIVPLDTHIFKIGRCAGWTQQKTQSYKAACEITDALKRFS
ncbi:MAG TPA: TIGR02757 family protein, partial [Syntrophorhabdaceae bacterium]|nr:TIGR02757 family protein [Syntrophorhabdaceae bacterium]